MMLIDDKTYVAKDSNYFKIHTIKKQIILAFSLRSENRHINRFRNKELGKSKCWSNYSINREGVVYKHFDEKYFSNFIGDDAIDDQSISIVIENMGMLKYNPDNDSYSNWLNEVCDSEYVGIRSLGGFWEIIPDDQFNSIVSLCKYICDEFNIPKNCVEFQQYHKDIINFKGIVFRSNYYDYYSDINPFFDIKRFNLLLSE